MEMGDEGQPPPLPTQPCPPLQPPGSPPGSLVSPPWRPRGSPQAGTLGKACLLQELGTPPCGMGQCEGLRDRCPDPTRGGP